MGAGIHEPDAEVIFFCVMIGKVQIIPELGGYTLGCRQGNAQGDAPENILSFIRRKYSKVHKCFKINNLNPIFLFNLPMKGINYQ
jgi:hypothetical protein